VVLHCMACSRQWFESTSAYNVYWFSTLISDGKVAICTHDWALYFDG
jgi:hypothetical protein